MNIPGKIEIFTLFSWGSLLEALQREDSLKLKEIKVWRIGGGEEEVVA